MAALLHLPFHGYAVAERWGLSPSLNQVDFCPCHHQQNVLGMVLMAPEVGSRGIYGS